MQPKAAEFLLTYDICNECVCDDTLNVSPEYTVSIYTDNYAYVRRNSGRVSVENELQSNSRSRSETRGARAAVSTDDSQTNDKLEREGISRRNCDAPRSEIASSSLASLRGVCKADDAAISTGTSRKDGTGQYGNDFTNPSLRDDTFTPLAKTDGRVIGIASSPALAAVPRNDDACNDGGTSTFDDLSVVDIAYEYSREIFRQGGGSCSQNA